MCHWNKTVSIQSRSVVRWRNCLSEDFVVKSGIRLGDILSPVLFNIFWHFVMRAETKRWGLLSSSALCWLYRICRWQFCCLRHFVICNLCLMYVIMLGLASILLLTLVNHFYLMWVWVLLSISLGLTSAVMIFNGQTDLSITVSIIQGTYCNSYWFSLWFAQTANQIK